MEQTKVAIPFPDASRTGGLDIVGILAQKAPGQPTKGRPLALILHGVLAHKDQIYHKKLVQALDIDSFRFDFRANHETPGQWKMAGFEDDLEDMRCVIAYLRNTYGYRIELLVGHSRGALDSFSYLSRHGHTPESEIPYYVSLSARWRMHRIHDRDPIYNPAFEAEGFYRWKARVAGSPVEMLIRPEDVRQFEEWPIAEHMKNFPRNTDVLTIHGTGDQTVPVADSAYYANILSGPARRPGSHKLVLLDDADHNFKDAKDTKGKRNYFDEVVEIICTWFDEQRRTSSSPAALGAHPAGQEAQLEQSWKQSVEAGGSRGRL